MRLCGRGPCSACLGHGTLGLTRAASTAPRPGMAGMAPLRHGPPPPLPWSGLALPLPGSGLTRPHHRRRHHHLLTPPQSRHGCFAPDGQEPVALTEVRPLPLPSCGSGPPPSRRIPAAHAPLRRALRRRSPRPAGASRPCRSRRPSEPPPAVVHPAHRALATTCLRAHFAWFTRTVCVVPCNRMRGRHVAALVYWHGTAASERAGSECVA